MKSYWLHGWATDRLVFKDLIGCLDKEFRQEAETLDLPGFGVACPLGSRESYVGRILADIRAGGHAGRGLALVGWSLGALVALEAACALGDELQALVLISACGRFSRSEANPLGQDKRLLEAMCHSLARGSQAQVLDKFYRGMFEGCDSLARESFLKARRPVCRGPEPLIAGLRYLAGVDLGGCTGRVAAPVLILQGGRDKVIDPGLARDLERRLSEARLVVFEDAGHVPFLGREREFAALIGDFFRGRAETFFKRCSPFPCNLF
ncbi:MAG: alpha/beta fold hydrolase [Candidatus Glassbacteria bacterium]|nr:alpha/beta fold hydrolase [Candidatus Glassbacteria bacterium]